MAMKKNIKWSFQPAQWLSSAEEEDSADESRSVGWKLQYLIFFHRNPRTPAMSADSSQVGVALFPSY